jgi:hypothetical protein
LSSCQKTKRGEHFKQWTGKGLVLTRAPELSTEMAIRKPPVPIVRRGPRVWVGLLELSNSSQSHFPSLYNEGSELKDPSPTFLSSKIPGQDVPRIKDE